MPGPAPVTSSNFQQQFLVVPDRRPTQSLHSVALSYGTLPRAPRRAPPPSSCTSPHPSYSNPSPLPRPARTSSSLAPPAGSESLYATLSRSAAHHRQLSQPSLPGPAHRYIGPAHQPLRLDMPPETDWRCGSDFRTAWEPLTLRPRPSRDPPLCSLCRQLPAQRLRPFCPTCGAHLARTHPAS